MEDQVIFKTVAEPRYAKMFAGIEKPYLYMPMVNCLEALTPSSCKQNYPQLHKTASYTHYAQCRLLRNPSYPAFYNLFLSPHSHIPSKMGIKDFPRSVKLYSTLGGI